MIRKLSLTLSALVAALVMTFAVVAPASAHSDAFLSTPADDATVSTPVTELQFTFVEAVEQSFSPEVVLTSDTGIDVPLGAPTFDASGATMTVPIPSGALPNGAYTAVFRIVSADGHPASGELVFTVEGSDADALVAAPTEEVSAEPVAVTEDMLRTATAEETQGQLQLGLGLAAAAAVVVAGVLVIVSVRRRRNSGHK